MELYKIIKKAMRDIEGTIHAQYMIQLNGNGVKQLSNY
jgi:hypothetical protein